MLMIPVVAFVVMVIGSVLNIDGVLTCILSTTHTHTHTHTHTRQT